jgi:hypothetical protein
MRGRDGNGVPAAKLNAVLVSEIVWEILWTKEIRARRGDEAIEVTAPSIAHTAPIRRIVRSRVTRPSWFMRIICFRSVRYTAAGVLHGGDYPGDDRDDHC